MTGRPGEGWKIFENGEEADNVPLWKALAQFRSDDLDEGLNLNAAIINEARPSPVRNYNLAFVISFAFGFLSVVLFIGLLVSGHSTATDVFFFLTLVSLAATMAPHLWRQGYQYGLKIPDTPLELPHARDRLFDEVLGYLQKVDGPQVYYLSLSQEAGSSQTQAVLRQAALFPVLRTQQGSGNGHALPDRNVTTRRPLSSSR